MKLTDDNKQWVRDILPTWAGEKILEILQIHYEDFEEENPVRRIVQVLENGGVWIQRAHRSKGYNPTLSSQLRLLRVLWGKRQHEYAADVRIAFNEKLS